MSNKKPEQPCFSDNPRIDGMLERVVKELKAFTEEQAAHINDLVAIGSALSAEKDLNRVLEMILSQARKFTHADGGTLYLLTDDAKELVFHVLHNDSLKSFQGGTSGNTVSLPNINLYNEDGSPNHANVSAYVALKGEVINIEDVYEAEGFNFDGPRKFDESHGYNSLSMLVVPMRDHEGEIIGVLQLINSIDQNTKNAIPFARELEEVALALASQAAVALTQQRLIGDLKNLFESFIQAIATAIDEKSKYTGGHIARVTELTMMLANKVNESDTGQFASTKFSDDELEELRIAAWLHDTGKITTPEYVVDKANKLETVFDRIELVKSRWQTIKLNREIEAYKQLLSKVEDQIDPRLSEEIKSACSSDLEALDEDLQFLVNTNTGGEFMADEKLERLNGIASREFADDLGEYNFLTADEVENLSIRKGTLTSDERNIIENHAVMTLKILNEIPWPKKMKDVPAIAGAHHEKIDGSGYPSGFKGREINLQSRIMAIADVFEALSAKDRPYKKPMKLSQAIKILGFMVKDKHLDGDIVDLFVKSGVLEEYAKEHLSPLQVDMFEENEK